MTSARAPELSSRKRVATVFAAMLWSCAAPPNAATQTPRHEPTPTPAAASARESQRVEPPPETVEVPQTPAPTPDPPPCRRQPWTGACTRGVDHEWLSTEAIASWYTSRGARPPPDEIEPACREITLGSAAQTGLWCERIQHESRGKPGSSLHTFRVVVLLSVRAVRKKQVATLLELPLGVEILDKDELDDGPLIALVAEHHVTSNEIEIREPEPGACERSAELLRGELRSALAENYAPSVAWARLDEELRSRTCRSVGSYTWKGTRFSKPPPPRAGATSGASGP